MTSPLHLLTGPKARALRDHPDGARQAAELIRGLVCEPFDPFPGVDAVISAFGWRIRETELLPDQGGAQARLIPASKHNVFAVVFDPSPVNPGQPMSAATRNARSRFLVCHEIAHSIFFDESAAGPKRSVPYNEVEEEFCDLTARWMLIPFDAAAAAELTPDQVSEMCDHYQASVELVVRAISEAQNLDVTLEYFADDKWREQWKSDGTNRVEKAVLNNTQRLT